MAPEKRATDAFDIGVTAKSANEPDLTTFHAKIGRLTLGNNILESALIKAGMLSAEK